MSIVYVRGILVFLFGLSELSSDPTYSQYIPLCSVQIFRDFVNCLTDLDSSGGECEQGKAGIKQEKLEDKQEETPLSLQ